MVAVLLHSHLCIAVNEANNFEHKRSQQEFKTGYCPDKMRL